MGVETWLIYVSAILVLMSTPGPSQLLMLSNSISYGFRKSIYTATGDLTANFIQMIVASVGLVGTITSSQEFFIAVKWSGVGYLVYLGLRLIFANIQHQDLCYNREIVTKLFHNPRWEPCIYQMERQYYLCPLF